MLGNWRIWYGVTCQVLWYRKSTELFSPNKHNENAMMDISKRVYEIIHNTTIMENVGLLNNEIRQIKVKWEAPWEGCFELNSNGACQEGGA